MNENESDPISQLLNQIPCPREMRKEIRKSEIDTRRAKLRNTILRHLLYISELIEKDQKAQERKKKASEKE